MGLDPLQGPRDLGVAEVSLLSSPRSYHGVGRLPGAYQVRQRSTCFLFLSAPSYNLQAGLAGDMGPAQLQPPLYILLAGLGGAPGAHSSVGGVVWELGDVLEHTHQALEIWAPVEEIVPSKG